MSKSKPLVLAGIAIYQTSRESKTQRHLWYHKAPCEKRAHDAHPIRCRVPGYYESCSERVRVYQLKKCWELKILAQVGTREVAGQGNASDALPPRSVFPAASEGYEPFAPFVGRRVRSLPGS